MEAIKFSELPSGDRQDLGDGDGLPIIANQENRLLSWGQLKRQIAKQTHTGAVTADTENAEKVPTNAAVQNALTALTGEFNERLGDIKDTADGAKATANSALGSAGAANANAERALAAAGEAKTAAESASEVANAAKSSADGALAQLEEVEKTAGNALEAAENASSLATTAKTTAEAAQATANTAKTTAESAESKATEAQTGLSGLSERVGGIETKIENGELGGSAEEVDFTPLTGRLDALETTTGGHTTRIEALETANGTHTTKIEALETQTGTQSTKIEALETTAGTQAGEIATLNTSVATAQSAAETAQMTANTAQTAASSAQSAAEAAQATANTATGLAQGANVKADELAEKLTPTVELPEYHFSFDSDGEYNGSSYSHSEAQATELADILAVILQNQEAFFNALQNLYQHQRTYNNDIDAILTNLTNTFNAVIR